MREMYRHELSAAGEALAALTDDIHVAVVDATTALLEADIDVAERVISQDARIDAQHEQIEKQAFTLLARQAPVAGELRTVVAVLRMVFELARMGDLAAHVAKIARLRYPQMAVPDSLRANVSRMSEVADDMVRVASSVLRTQDLEVAETLAGLDEEMDQLRKDQFRIMLSDDWDESVEKAIDIALLGRYFERIADHAVALGGRVIYIITGEAPEGEDWPNA